MRSIFVFALKCREEGEIGIFITLVPNVLCKRFLIRWLQNFWTFILIGWFFKLSVQTFQPLIVIYRRGNLCIMIGTFIFRQLSYPFRSLSQMAILEVIKPAFLIGTYPSYLNLVFLLGKGLYFHLKFKLHILIYYAKIFSLSFFSKTL